MEVYLNKFVSPYVAQAIENIIKTNPDNKVEYLHSYLRYVGQQVERDDIERARNKYNAILEESENEFKSKHEKVFH